ERGSAGEKVALVRVFAGTLQARDRLRFRGDRDDKVTAISVFDSGHTVRSQSVAAGQIAQVWGLRDVRIGDAVGVPPAADGHGFFAPPTLETVVMPRCRDEKAALNAALAELAEQDPFINLRQDDRHELFVSLYGEVQKEVIQETLAAEYDLDVEFHE